MVLDFQRPWKRYDMIGTLEEKLGVKFPPGETLHTAETNVFLRELCVKVLLFFVQERPLDSRLYSTM
jgi:lysyl-tRNA synthetase class 2